MLNRIVVWDPDSEFWEGSLVDPVKAKIIETRDGAILPVDPALFLRSGVGGYMRRSWGSGWPLEHMAPKMVCPLSLYFPATHRVIHWVVRVVPTPRRMEAAANGDRIGEGTLRLVGDGIMVTPDSAPLDVRTLGKTDARGGWTFHGRSVAHPQGDGLWGFGLYGAAAELRVAWAAISATEAAAT